ncbi:hypothetical protein BDZ91DRAFT_709238 [Kalaharituber pfeilii]|nr:hypothetical protein BDZ91DRAFT_709238 [Kalaharituber pfeilii]
MPFPMFTLFGRYPTFTSSGLVVLGSSRSYSINLPVNIYSTASLCIICIYFQKEERVPLAKNNTTSVKNDSRFCTNETSTSFTHCPV